MKRRLGLMTALTGTMLVAGMAGPAGAMPTGVVDLDLQQNFRLDSPSPVSTVNAFMRVAPAGDVNGDGRQDLIVSVPAASGGFGAAWVVFGVPTSVAAADTTKELSASLDQVTAPGAGGGFKITDTTQLQLGIAITGGKDINGDGRADLVIGARPGVHVIFGKADDTPVAINALGTHGYSIQGADAQALDLADDMNGDGRAEIIIGDLLADNLPGGNVNENSGSAWVVFGKADTTPQNLTTLGAGGYEIRGASANDQAATSVAAVPDMTGDGRPEVVIGAPNRDDDLTISAAEGAAWVVHGRASGGTVIELASLDGDATDPGFKIGGPRRVVASFGANAGRSVAGADINGDGLGDAVIAVSNWNAEPSLTGGQEGGAFVIFGRPGTAPVSTNQGGTPGNVGTDGYRIDGASLASFTGFPTVTIPDINGDGRAEVMLGAGGSNTGSDAFVVFGKGTNSTIDLAQPGSSAFEFVGRLNPDGLDELAGQSGMTALDFNGDALVDFAISAGRADRMPVDANGSTSTGSIYIVYGRPDPKVVDLAALPASSVLGRIEAGTCASGPSIDQLIDPGDVNADGIQDFAVSSHANDSVYVIFGTATVPSGTLCALGAGGYRVTNVGSGTLAPRIAGKGDINGDGRDDLVIGANAAQGGNGVAYVVFGKADPSQVDLSTFPQTSQPQGFRIQPAIPVSGVSELGIDVAVLPDLNSDGRDEVVVTQFNPIGTLVIRGRQSGATVDLATDVNFVRHTTPVGRGVGAIADLTGDGRSEVLVGNPDPTNAFVNNGPFVIFGRSDLVSVDVATFPSPSGYELAGDLASGRLTGTPLSVGNVIGDARSDIAVLGESSDFVNSQGMVLVVPGSLTPPAFDSHTNPGLRIDAPSGQPVSAADAVGDLNGDTIADFLVGTRAADNRGRTDSGSVYFVFGKPGSRPINLSDLGREGVRLDGALASEALGSGVGALGDRSGDGIPDVTILATGTAANGTVLFLSGVLADVTAPDTTAIAGPTAPVTGTTATFTFSSPEAGMTFQCSLDGAPFIACSSPLTLSGLLAGQHTLHVRAVDPQGNADPTPAVFVFRVIPTLVDTLPPVVSSVSLSRTTFAPVGVRSTRRPAPKRGVAIRWTLSESATTTLRFERLLPGRRRGTVCVPNRQLGPRCTTFRLAGTVTRSGVAGRNSFTFNGHLRKKPLPAGRYRVLITARDAAGNVSTRNVRSFTIIR